MRKLRTFIVATYSVVQCFSLLGSEPKAVPIKVLVCDFHGVLADTNYPQAVAKGLLTLPTILSHALFRLLWKYPILKYLWQHHSLKHYPWPAIIDTFAPAAACQKLRKDVFTELEHIKHTQKCAAIYL